MWIISLGPWLSLVNNPDLSSDNPDLFELFRRSPDQIPEIPFKGTQASKSVLQGNIKQGVIPVPHHSYGLK